MASRPRPQHGMLTLPVVAGGRPHGPGGSPLCIGGLPLMGGGGCLVVQRVLHGAPPPLHDLHQTRGHAAHACRIMRAAQFTTRTELHLSWSGCVRMGYRNMCHVLSTHRQRVLVLLTWTIPPHRHECVSPSTCACVIGGHRAMQPVVV